MTGRRGNIASDILHPRPCISNTYSHTHTDHADKEPQEEPQSRRSEAGRSPDLFSGVKPSWPSKETQPQVLCHVSSYVRLLLKLCFTYDINLIMSQVSREHQSLYRYTEVDNIISRSWNFENLLRCNVGSSFRYFPLACDTGPVCYVLYYKGGWVLGLHTMAHYWAHSMTTIRTV